MTRRTLALALYTTALCALPLSADSLGPEIDRLIDTTPSVTRAFWGVQIVEMGSGTVLYSRNADHLFVPASNAKLFTLALALSRLGPAFRFQTRVVADAEPDANGTVQGPLRLVGGGDPNLSARAIPYRPGPVAGNPLAAIDDLADQLVKRGIRRVEGGIVGDDTRYLWEPYPEGWAADDTQFEYGAPVSALSINDNAFTLRARPGPRAGDLAELTLNPPLEYYEIDNRVRTVAAGGVRKIEVERTPGGRQLRLWGTIPLRDPGEENLLAVDDPAQYAAWALARALEDRGITVRGEIGSRHRYPSEDPADETAGAELAVRESAPLLEDLKITAKVSQNLHAELALRAVARARRTQGSREEGLEEMKAFLTESGIEPEAYSFHDGSGLSRLDLLSPAAVVRLLEAMYDSPQQQDWISLLPIGGQDGTLNARFSGNPSAARIHAKTGTLTHVNALSGYIQRRDGVSVAFSILVNNDNGPAGDVRSIIDRICTLIVE